MKRIHIEAAILSIVYIVFTIIAIQYFGAENLKITNIFTYPAKLIIKPITNGFNIESINISLFTTYFLWSFNCVYMSFLKKNYLQSIKTPKKVITKLI
jgi:hypothetical protein